MAIAPFVGFWYVVRTSGLPSVDINLTKEFTTEFTCALVLAFLFLEGCALLLCDYGTDVFQSRNIRF